MFTFLLFATNIIFAGKDGIHKNTQKESHQEEQDSSKSLYLELEPLGKRQKISEDENINEMNYSMQQISKERDEEIEKILNQSQTHLEELKTFAVDLVVKKITTKFEEAKAQVEFERNKRIELMNRKAEEYARNDFSNIINAIAYIRSTKITFNNCTFHSQPTPILPEQEKKILFDLKHDIDQTMSNIHSGQIQTLATMRANEADDQIRSLIDNSICKRYKTVLTDDICNNKDIKDKYLDWLKGIQEKSKEDIVSIIEFYKEEDEKKLNEAILRRIEIGKPVAISLKEAFDSKEDEFCHKIDQIAQELMDEYNSYAK